MVERKLAKKLCMGRGAYMVPYLFDEFHPDSKISFFDFVELGSFPFSAEPSKLDDFDYLTNIAETAYRFGGTHFYIDSSWGFLTGRIVGDVRVGKLNPLGDENIFGGLNTDIVIMLEKFKKGLSENK